MQSTSCISCGKEVEGSYCSSCGEKVKASRITWKYLFSDWWDKLVSLDGPFLRTLKLLTLRPGEFVRSYIKGSRVGLVKPGQFFLIAVTLHSLSLIYLFDIRDLMHDQAPMGQAYNEAQLAIFAKIQEASQDWGKTLQFLTLPFTVFFTWLFFRRRSKMSFLENMVLLMYTSGYLLILNIIMTQILRVLPSTASTVFSFITFFGVLFYHGWAISKFHAQKGAGNLIRGMVAICLGMFLFSGLVGFSAVFIYWDEVKDLLIFSVPNK